MAAFDDDYLVRTFNPALDAGEPDADTAAWLGATRIGFHEKADPDAVRESAIGAIADGRVFTGVYPRRPVAGSLGENGPALWPVGTFTGYTKTINVGGGRLVEAYLVSDVTVRPTHRRRGMLRTMMTERLAAAASAGHALAALTASESTIYRRFGFGPATRKRTLVLHEDVPVTLLGQPTGRVELVAASSLVDIAPRVFERYHRTTPGSVDRQGQYANRARGLDYSTGKPDQDARAAIHLPEGGGEADGYVVYSMREDGGDSVLEIADLVAATPDAFLGLWEMLGSIDLVQRIRWSKAPVETPLLHALTASRSLTVERETDHTWLRVLDVPRALSARPYARDGQLTLKVHDALGHAAGVFRLEAADADGHATRVADSTPASLELDAATLASLYLGGVSATVLGEAGLIAEHARGALALASQLFAAERPVHSITDF